MDNFFTKQVNPLDKLKDFCNLNLGEYSTFIVDVDLYATFNCLKYQQIEQLNKICKELNYTYLIASNSNSKLSISFYKL